MKQLGYFSSLCLTLFFTNCYAQDYCSGLNNTTWHAVTVASGSINCTYESDGTVTGQNNNYTLNFHATKTSGNGLCPNTYNSQNVKFECHDNTIIYHSFYGVIRADIQSSNAMRLSGKINFMGMQANISGDAILR